MRLPLAFLSLVALLGAASALASPAPRPTVATDLSKPVHRSDVLRLVLERNPGLQASRTRALALSYMALSEGKLPAPEAEFQLWQVPVSRPYAVGDAQMIMVGIRQPIPAPGSLGAKAEVKRQEAGVELSIVDEKSRDLVREAGHAFVEYAESTELHHVHARHKSEAELLVQAAKARYTAGGPLQDIAQAEVETARVDADMAEQEAKMAAAQFKLNALLLRPPQSPLGPPVLPEPLTAADGVDSLIATARRLRPELRSARARQNLAQAEVAAAQKEAAWPMMSVGALYFAPTNNMPSSGYGLSFSASLPWLWGKASSSVRAQRTTADAAAHDVQGTVAKIDTEVATSFSAVQTSVRRYQVLRDRALPAARRAYDAAVSGYASGRTEILSVLASRTAVVEIDVELVSARASIDHALEDLDWAVGETVRRQPIAATGGTSP